MKDLANAMGLLVYVVKSHKMSVVVMQHEIFRNILRNLRCCQINENLTRFMKPNKMKSPFDDLLYNV